jgi:hypothetical protein
MKYLRRHPVVWVVVCAVVALGVAGTALAGLTELVSVDSSGAQSQGASGGSAISGDGRFVAFTAVGSDLVPGDTNGYTDVLVHDRLTGETTRVSVDSLGGQGNQASWANAISGDGRFVAFEALASNLVSGDTNRRLDIFVHDRVTGVTERVSIDSLGQQANDESEDSWISADGRFVSYFSRASNLVSGDTNGNQDIFVRDRQAGTTERVSVDGSGIQANGSSWAARISADGRFVVFSSSASNLVANDTNGATDVFVHDRTTGATERVSVGSSGDEGNGPSGVVMPDYSAISDDGRFVAFESLASNLVPGDTNGSGDIFMHDRQTGLTGRVSVDSAGGEANGPSTAAAISADGSLVAFVSSASNLVARDTNGVRDVFVRRRDTGTTERIDVTSTGSQVGKEADFTGFSISGDGRFVSFGSFAPNLVPGDRNHRADVFVRDRVGLPPTISSYQPTSGITGASVTIYGSHLDAATAVTFNGKKALFKIVSVTELKATVPNGATTGAITVLTPNGDASSPGDYVVTFSIVKLSPKTGPVGTTVAVSGVGFSGVTGVHFGGVSAAFTVVSDTKILTTVPAGAITGKVTATSFQGTVTGPRFRVTQ